MGKSQNVGKSFSAAAFARVQVMLAAQCGAVEAVADKTVIT